MSKLSSKTRNKLPSSDFAEPGKRKYPVNDKAHARNALARVSQFGSPAEKAAVKKKVKSKFPSVAIGGKKTKKSGKRKSANKKG